MVWVLRLFWVVWGLPQVLLVVVGFRCLVVVVVGGGL